MLHTRGARVPRAFAVTTHAYRSFIERLDSRISSVLDAAPGKDIASLEQAATRITELVKRTPIPKNLVQSIESAYAELTRAESSRTDLPVAVRSSATSEDVSGASAAGQHESFLWIRGAEGVVEHVRECWASAFTARSMAYRKARGISRGGAEMGVVVQRMVDSVKSGVIFTLNPANGDRSKISIDATWGLGEAVVSGVVTPDFYLVDKVTLEILTKRVGKKLVEFVVSGDEVVEREVHGERRDTLCLADEEVLELARTAKSIEKAFGKPQDIEWAIEDASDPSRGVYILQARPETVWSAKKVGPKAEPKDAVDRVIDTLKRGQRIQ